MEINYQPIGHEWSTLTLFRNHASIKMKELQVTTTSDSYFIEIEIPNRGNWEQFLKEKNFRYSFNDDTILISFIRPDEVIWLGWVYSRWCSENCLNEG